MKNNLYRKSLVFVTTALMVGLVFGSAVNAGVIGNKQVFDMPAGNGTSLNLDDYTNITVEETWELANDTANGIQIPVDVRTDLEWKENFIDTPVPENPRHYCLDLLETEPGLEQFLELYSGKEVILYCKSGYRSFKATRILIDNNFTGKIYNMIGGMNAWETAGLPTFSGGYLNITVYEAWTLLNDTANCIQIPIDVRTDQEWVDEHIDTPPPEDPIHYCLDLLQDPTGLQDFLSLYGGRQVILYCKGGYRSFKATKILLGANFTGTVYNMIGGINAWNAAGLPTKSDEPPTVEILNPKEGYFHFSGKPLFPTLFNLLADTASLGGFRLKPITIKATDDIDESKDLTVKVYLNGEDQGNAIYSEPSDVFEYKWTGWALGTYNLTVTAEDAYSSIGSAEMLVWNFCFIP